MDFLVQEQNTSEWFSKYVSKHVSLEELVTCVVISQANSQCYSLPLHLEDTKILQQKNS